MRARTDVALEEPPLARPVREAAVREFELDEREGSDLMARELHGHVDRPLKKRRKERAQGKAQLLGVQNGA